MLLLIKWFKKIKEPDQWMSGDKVKLNNDYK